MSIDFIFGVGDYVREFTSPAKVGSGPMSGRDATCDKTTAHTREPIFTHNSSKDAVWSKKDPFRMKNV